jgi:uncharacterized protein (TIGR02599 family)
MVRKLNRQRGFTLIEAMISVTILGIVFSLGPSLLKNMTRFSRLSTARIETQRNARDALNQINQSLRQASAGSIVISNEASQSPFSSISFTTVDGRAMKFYQQSDDLKFVQAGSTVAVADGLRYIAFSYPRTDNFKIVSVSVTFEKATYEGGAKALQMAIEKVRIMND